MSVYRYLRRVFRHQRLGIILHYDSTSGDLRVWYWPINDIGERVAPADLPHFRLVHDFRAPCCLCAYHGPGGNYTESAMFIAEDGPNFGKYMAGCASGHCDYLICVEDLYATTDLQCHEYPLREAGVPAPLPILYLPRNNRDNVAISRPTHRAGGARRMYASMPVYGRPIRRPETSMEKFLKLDSWGRAGLRESEFKKLFSKCVCGLVMTRRVFEDHECIVTLVPDTIIDLTSESGDVLAVTAVMDET